MNLFEKAEWIWSTETPSPDEYAEFYTSFLYEEGDIRIAVSADSNYAVYINGALVVFGQYADYPYDKIYDIAELRPYCVKGENSLAIVVWYYGTDKTSVYYPGNAGLIFDVFCDGKSICRSGAHTLSRKSRAYVSHREKILTGQLGYSFFYDAAKEDGWKTGEGNGFSESTVVAQNLPLRVRPCEKLCLEEPKMGNLCKTVSPVDLIFDLGINTVGFLRIEAKSENEQTLLISYGEHLADGVVRRKIGTRDFSVRIGLKKGTTVYMNPFRRLGCKFLEVQSEKPLEEIKVSIVPTVYPVLEQFRPPLDSAENDIYDICIRTLKLCMHEHYEDCPWREQALYAMDSRNQMLCGYYAFGETHFPRANLELIAKDNREDGLLSICYPIKMNRVIPSFSLHYFTACAEYLRYSGDLAFLKEIYPKLESVLFVFLSRMKQEGNVILPFEGEGYWNFYEWQTGIDGDKNTDLSEPDLILNALLSLALQRMAEIANELSLENRYEEIAEMLNRSVRKYFYCEEKELFADRMQNRSYSVLGNSLAVLCGACEKEKVGVICEKMISNHTLTPISLSMKCFLYDALLMEDSSRYREYILSDIRTLYRPMVEYGVGTVWETEKGEADFHQAGSLCHGWSAMPIYYYHVLKG
ncbi:MAG: family 78 glycoside hydrolase catalytic domain [Clostridia bacterium]|nr:family 78 glycoside hydrolase catalytic domain [Clostridia bacterium]